MLGLRQDHSNSFSAKAGPLDDRDFIVGAGLLANAFCQSTYSFLIRRVRQQAGSYKKMRSVMYDNDRSKIFETARPKWDRLGREAFDLRASLLILIFIHI